MTVEPHALAPEDIPRIVVASMQHTHEEEVGLVNELAALSSRVQAGEERPEALDDALQHWLEHTEAHFARENALMQEHGFPPYPVHAHEHEMALKRLRAVVEQWREQRDLDGLAHFVMEEWPAWFTRHVSSMDYVTAEFLSRFID